MTKFDRFLLCLIIGITGSNVAFGFIELAEKGSFPSHYASQVAIGLCVIILLLDKNRISRDR